MKTIQELTALAREGESAQDQLNSIAENIYDVYVKEIEIQTEELEKEFPCFDSNISELTRCNSGFHKYSLTDKVIYITGRDYFRGETDYEYDSLPIGVFIDDTNERNRLIKEFVSKKFEDIRNSLVAKQRKEDEEARQQYESLKERFGTK